MTRSALIERFRQLHTSGCFVVPNPWDVGSAVALARCGFPALATTSAGLAFSLGRRDQVGSVSLDETLAHLEAIAAATSLPVTADFQAGFADDLESIGRNVAACLGTGVAGLSIEDATGDPGAPLFGQADAVARVRAAREAIDAAGSGAVLTARCEAFLYGDPDPARTAIDRLVAFADAGADCLFAPGVQREDTVADMVRAVAPRALNVIVTGPGPGWTVARLEALGVRRISVGSAMARVAWAAFLRAARGISETGSFDELGSAAAFADIDALFR